MDREVEDTTSAAVGCTLSAEVSGMGRNDDACPAVGFIDVAPALTAGLGTEVGTCTKNGGSNPTARKVI